MKTFFFFLFAFSLTALSAQVDSDFPYVQGPVYKVINDASGPVILWEGKAASPDQIVRSAPDLITVYPPHSFDPRLLIYLQPNGRLKEVIDLEYEPRPADRPAVAAAKAAAFKNRQPVRVDFRNGLVFTFEDGMPAASLRGELLPVTGANGRYRIVTEAFEAGVAFGPEYGATVYQYLKEH